MSTRVNLVLDDEVKRSLDELVPAGQRSEFASLAIRAQLDRLKRERAADRLEELRGHGPSVPTDDIVRLLRDARERPR